MKIKKTCQYSEGDYVVKDEDTLCYATKLPLILGVLATKKTGGDPYANSGTTPILSESNIRLATIEDFTYFRVQVPPDFKQEFFSFEMK